MNSQTHKHPDADSTPPGVLLVNLGTPDSPSVSDVRRYLREFLWDPRVVEVARPVWWLVLNLVILTTRPSRSAKAYAKVWTAAGSPLLVISKRQQAALQAKMENRDIFIEAGGEQYGYIEYLNDHASHIQLFSELIAQHTRGWAED